MQLREKGDRGSGPKIRGIDMHQAQRKGQTVPFKSSPSWVPTSGVIISTILCCRSLRHK